MDSTQLPSIYDSVYYVMNLMLERLSAQTSRELLAHEKAVLIIIGAARGWSERTVLFISDVKDL